MERTVENATGFSAKLANPANALSKSIGFGATKNPPAKDARLTTFLTFRTGWIAVCPAVEPDCAPDDPACAAVVVRASVVVVGGLVVVGG